MALYKLLSRRIFQHNKHSSTRTAPPLKVANDGSQFRSSLPCTSAAFDVQRWITLQQRPMFQSPVPISAASVIRMPSPIGDTLIERIRSSMPQELDGLAPAPPGLDAKGKVESLRVAISVEDARRLLKASRVEAVRTKLRAIPSNCVPYTDFAQICREVAGGVDESGREIEAALDSSGAVVIVDNVVLLHPEQVAQAIQSVILMSPGGGEDPRMSELRKMEAEKAVIDSKAEAQVKKELWVGLALVLLQTTGFVRLTFWELSWDVMEPVCFFTTSISFMLGYAFFLRTAREPSFEGFFAGRLAAKRRRLMKDRGFNQDRFNELRGDLLTAGSPSACLPCHHCRCQSESSDTTLLRAVH